MNQFLSGVSAGLSMVIGLFFLKYWRATRERLFACFAAAFAVLSAHWAALGLGELQVETRHYVFLLRLAAFALIIAAIADKNRNGRGNAR
ncbi:MAG TPA: DUF5985 family protein [Polyangiaceae bacterium]|nr:DUF5985 family protein [Polyangiaceae bacterium]